MSCTGTTLPSHFFTSSGYSFTASLIERKITPAFSSSARKVVATLTESNTASTAMRREPSTPASIFCSSIGMPSFS